MAYEKDYRKRILNFYYENGKTKTLFQFNISSSKIAAGKGITGERIDNSGTFATNGDIKATNSLVNSGTVDGKGIDVAGADFVNSGKINADNIKANVTNTRNDGFIYSGNDV